MALVSLLLSALFWILSLGSSLAVAYLVLLTIAALFRPPRVSERVPVPADFRLVILVPAHNEASQLPLLAKSLAKQTLPTQNFTVHVVADNCTDATAKIGRQAGFTVHERSDAGLRGKGHALDWLIKRIDPTNVSAFVFIDADSQVSPNFLERIGWQFAIGARAVQVFYGVADPEASWSKAARAAAMLLVNGLRPLGRSNLGGSAGVKGTGMAFAPDLLRGHSWGSLLAEDAAFHLDLVLQGERVIFDDTATVMAHVPASLEGAQVQNKRWEAGRLELVRTYVPRLLSKALRGSGVALDSLADLLVPPLSMLVAVILVGLLGGAILGSSGLVWLAVLSIVGLAFHVLAGMAIAGASGVHYRALAMAPALILWKVRLYLPLLFGRRPDGWIKTERD
ncbi:glycosyltransferase family 2 protein [uncultured Alsobacter sp.]|uniref:glycosyltransferase family 2 protein n=1 Tax=uncultured Alsobacter sp. TaxID=1748258 RepID=UPI0025E99A76|nr:glycosyltransferase family 2 protein [uncultured Alsobacter sp.]